MRNCQRAYDLVVFGATGFTGRFVVEYLAAEYAAAAQRPRIAIAGRDRAKLRRLLDETADAAWMDTLVAAVDDLPGLAAMAAQAKVVITTVGPFANYGEPVLRACLAHDTDYADLAGEPIWIRAMIDRYGPSIRPNGARVAFASGYDCIPVELGVRRLQDLCRERFGGAAPRVEARVRFMSTDPSGGSVATGRAMAEALRRDPGLASLMADPFALTPGFAGPPQPIVSGAEWDPALGAWLAPSIMHFINSKIVHRSNQLRGFPYGRDFVYHEATLIGTDDEARHAATTFSNDTTRGLARLPEPGDGPPREACLASHWDYLLAGVMPDGSRLHLGVTGQHDAGYASTARMLAETGLALAASEGEGGLSLPGVLLGDALVSRLERHAGIAFRTEN